MDWIKCYDQLPDKDQYVLTYSVNEPRCPKIGYYSTTSNQWLMTCGNPTHWCELPELPKL